MPKKKLSASATLQPIDAEREQRVAARDRVDYSYAVFWTKNARLWDAAKREAVAQRLAELIASADFDANFYQRTYTLAEVDEAHSGASLLALHKVLQALRNE
jgi:rhamnogalacturonyl hydrolase YesR